MKQYDKIKTVQLIIYVILTIAGLVSIFTNKDLYHLIATDDNVKFFFGILWAILAISFVFMFVDFTAYAILKREYRELDLAIFSDPITGIANRHSCDAIIEKYLDKPLPKDIGCITFDIINLAEINNNIGYVAGNKAIRDFSEMLQSVAGGICFVGRNGGNKFLAIFEECTEDKINDLLEKLDEQVDSYNDSRKGANIDYKYGVAFGEGNRVANINQLIALSNRRAIEAYRTFVDR